MYGTHQSLTAVHTILSENDELCSTVSTACWVSLHLQRHRKVLILIQPLYRQLRLLLLLEPPEVVLDQERGVELPHSDLVLCNIIFS